MKNSDENYTLENNQSVGEESLKEMVGEI